MKEKCDEKARTISFWKKMLETMSHFQLGMLYRNAPAGHPVFNREYAPLYDLFLERFNAFGGMTPKLSRQIGW